MQLQPAYLLHRRPYRETSALVDLVTMEHGRIRAVARGIMRPSSKARSRLQPFTPLHITWSGERELKTLKQYESGVPGPMLAGESLVCGIYANELLTRCLPLEGAVPTVFAGYSVLLNDLPSPAKRQGALRRFEHALLEALDAEPVFTTQHEAPLEPKMHYLYDSSTRRFYPVAPGEGIDGRSLNALARDDWGAPGHARTTKYLARTALAPLLGAKPLRSRELIHRLNRTTD
ncbi:DNA repair protein RecO [Larsenimonas suaedae]|uniref:DNA repair protein RecO n=1 Tax=Larsenimonas suaedae TaxID=1851019 RepID=A0ABU1GV18_9GAMM|nr:DNA repair protein RecO [Larsenimonas suaedae]MCM2971154.1 DNA repair protein RecO [Larsenimonas suaedae]MDR5895863.1 DNA repair protein RecO [Larsenimonas suaedae]